jgi:hypothetical protein
MIPIYELQQHPPLAQLSGQASPNPALAICCAHPNTAALLPKLHMTAQQVPIMPQLG